MNKHMDLRNKIWVCFLNDNGQRVEGYFIKVGESDNFLKIEDSSGTNVLTIPFHRILKVKESIQEMKGGSNKK